MPTPLKLSTLLVYTSLSVVLTSVLVYIYIINNKLPGGSFDQVIMMIMREYTLNTIISTLQKIYIYRNNYTNINNIVRQQEVGNLLRKIVKIRSKQLIAKKEYKMR